ncbi:hypothetical protein FGO68_gene3392 [Halteria grandinella]|uniref:Uncharacterized protein n=1 Tax=Halteria grandinella TaxID=5974 RepID=A0A8J8NTM5_HALGN|nr:hypothetical protein FGO68_gene3392 [Halteria grandinella]
MQTECKVDQMLEDLKVIEVETLSLRGKSVSKLLKNFKFLRPKKNGILKLWPNLVSPKLAIEWCKILSSFNLKLSRLEIKTFRIHPECLQVFEQFKLATVQSIKLLNIDKYFAQYLIFRNKNLINSPLQYLSLAKSSTCFEFYEFLKIQGQIADLKVPIVEISLQCTKGHPILDQHDLIKECLEYWGHINIKGSEFSDLHDDRDTDNNYLGVLTCQILKSYPNLRGFKIQEEYSGGMIKPIEDQMMDGIRFNNLQVLTIIMRGLKNYSFYLQLLTLTKDKVEKLQLIADGDSFRAQIGIMKREESFLEVIEGSKSITSLKAEKDFFLLPREIKVLPTLPNLTKLSVDRFDADAMQELLELEFTKGLQNLVQIKLLQSVPHPESAFKGSHKSLLHLKYACTQRQKEKMLNLAQTLAIVEGKKFGFKFTTLFEDDKEFQIQCPNAVLLDPQHNWPWNSS